MKIESIKNQVMEIAYQRPMGFTYVPGNDSLVSSGYVVANKQTQDCFGKKGLHKVVKFCMRHTDYCIGGWCNEDGTMQFDASKVYSNVKEAITAAIANEQRAIFNLYTGREIMACDYKLYA